MKRALWVCIIVEVYQRLVRPAALRALGIPKRVPDR